jgi:hypothetical protein
VSARAALDSFLALVKYRYYLYTDFDLAIFAQATDGILGARCSARSAA